MVLVSTCDLFEKTRAPGYVVIRGLMVSQVLFSTNGSFETFSDYQSRFPHHLNVFFGAVSNLLYPKTLCRSRHTHIVLDAIPSAVQRYHMW